MKRILLVIFLIFSLPIFSAEAIKEVGKIDFDKKSNTYFFYFLKENKLRSVIIRATDKKEAQVLKTFISKTVILEGEIKPFVKTGESFVYREEIDNPRVKEITDELLKIDTKKIMTQLSLTSHEKSLKKIKANDKPTFGVGDKTSNAVIGVAGAIVGVAAGPIALIPAAAYLVNEAVSK